MHASFPYETHTKEYNNKFRQLVFNLKKNAELRENVELGSTPPDALVAMGAEDLATAERKAENERMRDFQFQKRDLDWSKKNRDRLNKQIGVDESINMDQCINPKCRSKRLSNHEKQTRSADEPMTQFFECLDCGKRWRT